MATTAGLGTADRAVGSRVGASVVALTWAVCFFGIIDFLVAIIPSEFPDFMPFVVLETSWGLLYTFLLPMLLDRVGGSAGRVGRP